MLYQASDVSSAVKMAEDMKRRGTHDWFRGQTRNWTLQSSLNRTPAKYDEFVVRFKRFSQWLKSTPGLEQLWHDVDATVQWTSIMGTLLILLPSRTKRSFALLVDYVRGKMLILAGARHVD